MNFAGYKIRLVAVFLFLVAVISVSAQDKEFWEGQIELPEIDLKIEVTFVTSPTGTSATIKIPEQAPLVLPLQEVEFSDDKVYFELVAGPGLAVFDGSLLSESTIEGTFTQGEASGIFFLEKISQEERDQDALTSSVGEPIELVTDTATIHGSLHVPEVENPPVALLVAGSGPTDRDGNTSPVPGMPMLEINTLKMLAIGLGNEGVATVRFDKRGVGESSYEGFSEAGLRFESYLDDVVAWLQLLKDDERFSQVFVVGHSEGATLAKLAATQLPVAGVVSLAGPAVPADRLLIEQFERNLEMVPEEQRKLMLDQLASALSTLKEKGELAEVPPMFQPILRPSIQKYMVSWIKYDPSQVVADLEVPILVVQGGTDLQVLPKNGPALSEANPDAELVMIDDMGHVLKKAGGDITAQLQVMMNPQTPLHEELVPAIADFVRRATN